MSTLPEAKLAAEAEIAYQVIIMSTDYDVSGLCVNSNNPSTLLFHSLPYHNLPSLDRFTNHPTCYYNSAGTTQAT